MLDSLKALRLLEECTGDDIWPIAYCREQGIPETWIGELRDCYESGFDSPSQVIFYRDSVINQFEGLRDVDLALRLGEFLGIDVSKLMDQCFSRSALVAAIKEAIEEG